MTLAANSVEAFWGTSHLLVAAEAQRILEAENPAVFQAVLNELNTLKVSHPSLTNNEENHPFVECATFADDIKGEGYSFQSGWHFIDQPYLIDPDTSLDDFDFTPDEYDILGALTALTQWLSGSSDDYLSTYYYDKVHEYFPDEADARSFNLRLVIHYVGDIHQPLHTVSGVDSYDPKGDAGGNAQRLPSICGASNLHAVWDSEAYNYCGYVDLPLSEAQWEWYETTSADIASNYPVDMNKLYDNNWAEWAREGYELAATVVYPGFEYYQPLTDEYIETMNTTLRSQMMYGSRRLADLLVSIYGSNTTESFLQ